MLPECDGLNYLGYAVKKKPYWITQKPYLGIDDIYEESFKEEEDSNNKPYSELDHGSPRDIQNDC